MILFTTWQAEDSFSDPAMGQSDPSRRDTGVQTVMTREPPSPRGHARDTDSEQTGETEAAFSLGTTQAPHESSWRNDRHTE